MSPVEAIQNVVVMAAKSVWKVRAKTSPATAALCSAICLPNWSLGMVGVADDLWDVVALWVEGRSKFVFVDEEQQKGAGKEDYLGVVALNLV